MKKNVCILFIILAYSITTYAQTAALTFSPVHPRPGELVRFEYDLTNSPLRATPDDIEVLVLESGNRSPMLQSFIATRRSDHLTGFFTPDPASSAVLLTFKTEKQLDNNQGHGFALLLNNAAGKPLPAAAAAQAMLLTAGSEAMQLRNDNAALLDLYGTSFKADPTLRQVYATKYIPVLQAAQGEAAKPDILALLDIVSKDPKSGEADWLYAAAVYEKMDMPDQANALREKIKTTWPTGSRARQERQWTIARETDPDKRAALIETYKQDFPAQTDQEKEALDQVYYAFALALAKQQNWARLEALDANLKPEYRANMYNGLAWDMAEQGEDLERAERYGREVHEIAKDNISTPVRPKPALQTERDWLEERRQGYAQNADTYAFVLSKRGQARAAADLQREVVRLTKQESGEMNERYTEYLEAAAAPELRYELEGYLLRGQATAKMKEQFARIYQAEDNSEAGRSAYLQQLEAHGAAAHRDKLAATMLSEPAPAFSLQNLRGETVSLESLRGKVVVVDFWATWCGPCKMSFPGMQKVIQQYQNDPGVAFLFLDTWEQAPDPAKNAGDFISSKNYPFHVLLDAGNVVVSKYGVTGIPTKFVVDGAGNIRFKAVGFDGEDALVEELGSMIELAKGGK